MEGKGGLRERSELNCPGETWMRRMQKARCCSSGGCPRICLSCQGSNWSSDPAETSPPDPHTFSYPCMYPSLHLPIPSPLPSIHPSTPGHQYLLPNASRPSPYTHPTSPPSPWPHCVRQSGSCDRALGSPVSPRLGNIAPSPLLGQLSQLSLAPLERAPVVCGCASG